MKHWMHMIVSFFLLACVAAACGGSDQKDPETTQYTLFINVTPANTGRVFDATGAVDCADACTYDLNEGTVLTLSAEAGTGFLFGAWSGACDQQGACQITLDADSTVGAAFSVDPNAPLDPAGDLDLDGLTNGEEQHIYGTSPWLDDTDGDGYSDWEEIVTYGFDASNDPFKFNPLVADVPKIKVNLVSPPGINLDMSSSVSGSTTVTAGTSRETSTSVSNTETTTNTTSVTNKISRTRASIGSRWGDHIVPNVGTNDYSTSTTEENSFSWSETQSTENSQAYSESEAVTHEEGFSYDGGRLSMLVKVENKGNISFTLENLVLSAIQVNGWGEEIAIPIGNLNFDSTGGVFPETTLGPGEVRPTLVFEKDDMDLETTLSLLKDSRGLLLAASSYELTDEHGIAFNHALTAVRAKTALVIIDYGPGTDRSPEYHMVATNIDFVDPGVTLDAIFANHLYIPYETNDGLVSVRGVAADPGLRKDWSVLHLYKENGEDLSDFFNTEKAAFDFDAIKLRAGDVLHLIYRDDEDDDALGQREEFLFGTDPALADTDSDTLDDGTEAYGYPVPGVTLHDAWVLSNPRLIDSDNDGVTDGNEISAQTDPTSRFPVKRSSGGDAEALDAVADYVGNLYVVGYGTNLPNASGKDWWIKKISPLGADGWDLRYDAGADGGGGGYGDGGKARAVALSPLGELYVVGTHTLPYNIASQEYWWVKKFNAWDGSEITEGWNKGFDRQVNGASDSAMDVALDSAGNVYVVGYASKIAGSASGRDWWIKKYAPSGAEDTTHWNKSFDSGNFDDEATAVVIDALDNVYVAGHGVDLEDDLTGKDWRIVKYNSSGDLLWTRFMDGGHYLDDVVTSMAVDAAGDLYVAGSGVGLAGQGSGPDGVVRKFSALDGQMVAGWEKLIYGQGSAYEVANDVLVSAEDVVYAVGVLSNQGGRWFVRSYAIDGTVDDAAQSLKLPAAASYSLDVAKAIAQAPNGTFYVVGTEGFYPDQNPANAIPHSWWLEKFYDWLLPVEE